MPLGHSPRSKSRPRSSKACSSRHVEVTLAVGRAAAVGILSTATSWSRSRPVRAAMSLMGNLAVAAVVYQPGTQTIPCMLQIGGADVPPVSVERMRMLFRSCWVDGSR